MSTSDTPVDPQRAEITNATSGTDSFMNTEVAPPSRTGLPPFIVENLAGPLAAAVSAQTGDVFVTNSDSNSVAVISPGDISPNGASYKTWKDTSAKYTVAIAIGLQGRVLVVNRDSDSVSVFAPDGSLLETITHHQMKRPNCVAVSPITGDAFVTNTEWSNLVRIPCERIVTGTGDLTVVEDSRMGWTTGIAVSPKTGDVFLSISGNPQNNWAGAGLVRIPASRASGGPGEITIEDDTGVFHRCGGVTVARNGDVFVTNATDDNLPKWRVGVVSRIPAARAGGDGSVGIERIQSEALNDPVGGQISIVASQISGSVYVANKSNSTIVRIPYNAALGGSAEPEVVSDGIALREPGGLALSPITGDLYITQPKAGSLVRLDIGIEVTGAGEGQFYTVPPAVTSVILHTQGGSYGEGTGLDLRTTLAVLPGQQFYLVNQYNAAYIFARRTPKNPWEPLLVSGGAGTNTSVQTKGVPRSDGNGTIYPGNGGHNGGGGAGWGGGAGLGAYVGYSPGVAQAGSGSKGGDSRAAGGKGGLEGADGATTGLSGGGLGGQGAASLSMDDVAVIFTLTGGNSFYTGYLRGGAGYCAGGNSATGHGNQSGAGSGFAATGLDVTAAASPADNKNVPVSTLIPLM